MQSRFDFRNLRPQCQNCNRVLRGNLKAYRNHLVREIGEDAVLELENRKPIKVMTSELESLLVAIKYEYQSLIKEKQIDQKS